MKLFLVLLGLWAFSLAYEEEEREETGETLFSKAPELIQYVNDLKTTWKAGFNPHFEEMSDEVIRGLMGVILPLDHYRDGPIDESGTRDLPINVPPAFDSRTKWPHCPSIRDIRDQSACGSCWAEGAVEAMSDRICIGSEGKNTVHLSTDDLMSCCYACGNGCEGGMLLNAWEYWVRTGIVTGSNYTKHTGCRPYPFPPCEHHISGGQYKPCSKHIFPTPSCRRKCQKTYKKLYPEDKWYGKSFYSVANNVEAIQKEILTNGPVEAAFEVFNDFLHYRSGVYKHVAGGLLGGHAVKMLGWGTEDGTPYWLVANSWNTDWGDKGYFKILRGSDECGIESGITAGLAKL